MELESESLEQRQHATEQELQNELDRARKHGAEQRKALEEELRVAKATLEEWATAEKVWWKNSVRAAQN